MPARAACWPGLAGPSRFLRHRVQRGRRASPPGKRATWASCPSSLPNAALQRGPGCTMPQPGWGATSSPWPTRATRPACCKLKTRRCCCTCRATLACWPTVVAPWCRWRSAWPLLAHATRRRKAAATPMPLPTIWCSKAGPWFRVWPPGLMRRPMPVPWQRCPTAPPPWPPLRWSARAWTKSIPASTKHWRKASPNTV